MLKKEKLENIMELEYNNSFVSCIAIHQNRISFL